MFRENELRDGNTVHVNNYCNAECRESINEYKKGIKIQANRILMLEQLIKEQWNSIVRGRKLYERSLAQVEILLKEKELKLTKKKVQIRINIAFIVLLLLQTAIIMALVLRII